MNNTVIFYLPLGLEYGGQVYRKGSMHLATTADELAVQTSDAAGMNPRHRDLELLARVIDELDGLNPITSEILENLYEADFLYLQLMYKNFNGETETQPVISCPVCAKEFTVSLELLYEDMEIYKQEPVK